ncbi:MAG: energy-coupling factor transporter transmembrane component T [Anaerolineae bacterium]
MRVHLPLVPLMRNTLPWLTWALSAAVLTLISRNPLYITLIVLATWLVYLSVSRETPTAGNWRALLKIGLMIWLITVPFNALMNHQGEVVLFSLPIHWPLVGGPITLEAILSGLASGYALWALLFVFAALNLAVDPAQLTRAAPRFLYQAGIVTTIALTFVPQMLQSGREIREAQRIRGHRFRGWRDTLPLAMPLLTTAFEHAVQLAESMESRGLSGELTGLSPQRQRRQRALMSLGLVLMLAGLVLRLTALGASGSLAAGAGAGAAMLVYAFWDLGRHVRRTRYHSQRWGAADTVIVAASLTALSAGLLALRTGPGLLSYAPLAGGPLLPAFDIWLGIAVALLVVPGLGMLAQDSAVPRGAAPDAVAPGTEPQQ